MNEIIKTIKSLHVQIEKLRNQGLKEYPTRTIFIDPLLNALGWDVRDPDEVQLEYPTVDSKSVDYALKINRKPVLLIEAKQLNDKLEDVKSITQVVGYAANDGIEWCILTNGVRYKIFKVSEKASAPEKLLYEVNIDSKENTGLSIEQLASQLNRFSRESMANGVLDEIGREIFIGSKVRKALDNIFLDIPRSFIRLIQNYLKDDSVKPQQIQIALKRIWDSDKYETSSADVAEKKAGNLKTQKGAFTYSEEFHTKGKPREILELYRALDRLCQNLSPGKITRAYKKHYISWALGKKIFCCVNLRHSGLKVWLKIDPKSIDVNDRFARDMTKIGHWGMGDVELVIDSFDRLRKAEKYLQRSFDEKKNKKFSFMKK